MKKIVKSLLGKILITALFAVLTINIADAREVSPEQARRAVGNWLKRDKNPLGSRLGGRVRDSVTYRDTAGEPLFYVVKLDGGGFVVTSTDDGITPVIAFSESSEFVADERNPLWVMLNNDLPQRKSHVHARKLSGGASVVQSLRRQQQSGQGRFGKPIPQEPEEQWAELETGAEPPIVMASPMYDHDSANPNDVRVAPLVKASWDQDIAGDWVYKNGSWVPAPTAVAAYNYYTPPGTAGSVSNYPSGCVATAGAQIMRHHEWPKTAVAISRECKVDGYAKNLTMIGGTYDWSNMPFVPKETTPIAQRQAIGKLLYDIGVTLGMSYYPDGSSTDTASLKNVFTDRFGYADAAFYFHTIDSGVGGDTNLENAVLSSLDAYSPVALAIRKSGSTFGHAVVGDGYGFNSGLLYVHINMGWSGSADAWYNLPEIGPSYNVVRGYVYNISPQEKGDIISGRVLNTSGQPIAGASVTASDGTTAKPATTNAKGIYAMWVPAGKTYTVKATSGMMEASMSVTVGNSNRTMSNATPNNRWGNDFVLSSTAALTLDKTSQSVPSAGQTFAVGVAANIAWTANSNVTSWLTVTPVSASNNGTLTVVAAANTGAARAGTITVSGGSIDRFVTVSQ